MLKTAFISDLHLSEEHPTIANLFNYFLLHCVKEKFDALYILGDLFEIWIGDDDLTAFNQQMITSLASATAHGLKIYFQKGNRDFLIGQKFHQLTGVELLPDEKIIELYGEEILLMHGDTLCTLDQNYLKWRRFSHNPIAHTLLFTMWPLYLRKKLADFMRAKSKAHTASSSCHVMDVTETAVTDVIKKYSVRTLIHGHTHRPNIHAIDENAKRIVLAAWHDHGNVLICNSQGEKNLIDFDEKSLASV